MLFVHNKWLAAIISKQKQQNEFPADKPFYHEPIWPLLCWDQCEDPSWFCVSTARPFRIIVYSVNKMNSNFFEFERLLFTRTLQLIVSYQCSWYAPTSEQEGRALLSTGNELWSFSERLQEWTSARCFENGLKGKRRGRLRDRTRASTRHHDTTPGNCGMFGWCFGAHSDYSSLRMKEMIIEKWGFLFLLS